MCVAPVGKITKIQGNRGICDFEGVEKEISLMLLPTAKEGDYVAVHAGYAVQIVKDYKKLLQEMVVRNVIGERLLARIEEVNHQLGQREMKIMNFCGTHEYSIVKYGLRELLPVNIKLVSGPGCPVCVVPTTEIVTALRLLEQEEIILTTYGDMFRVPTPLGSLKEAKAQGKDVRIVYGIDEAVKIARNTDKQVVHFAIGFETTAPTTASALLEAQDLDNFSILSSHRFSAPVMDYVLRNNQMNGVICPGHVAAIVGEEVFSQVTEEFKIPLVISGFEPLDVLETIALILEQTLAGNPTLENQYARVVEEKGNQLARETMEKVFSTQDVAWRGFPILKNSRMILKKEFSRFDALKRFALEEQAEGEVALKGCVCGKILQGKHPSQCGLFGEVCRPDDPQGPCMVSQEGPCFIAFQYM